jgi:hypothetical protein
MNTFMDSSIVNHISKLSVAASDMLDDKDDWFDDKDDWFQRLDFELNVESAGCMDDKDSDDDFYQEHKDDREIPDDNLPADNLHSSNADVEIDFTNEIDSINIILSQCCYLLCYADIQIQVLCCETILSGFQSLGKVGSLRRKMHGESASNPLLPAIAEFWPSVVARLRSASFSLSTANKLSRSELSIRHIIASDQEQGPSRAKEEILTSNLLSIVSELCLSSDGFFADRFENDVYPIIAALMSDLLSVNIDGTGRTDQPSSFITQKQSLLLSIIRCLKCTFESGCQHGLAGLISNVGAMLFPWLEVGGPVGDETMVALTAMLKADGDALWRGLHVLSRRSFPCNPIPSSPSSTSCALMPSSKPVSPFTLSCSYGDGNGLLTKRACELLEILKGYPEQQL